MGAITGDNPNIFKSASIIYGNVKRDLSSYESAGVLDEGEFARHINHVLKLLGLGVYKEKEAFMAVNNFKACLPEDFAQLYVAYKCSPFLSKHDLIHQQGQATSVYNDVTWALLKVGSNCETVCSEEEDTKVLEKITVRQYVREEAVNFGFANFIPLVLGPHTKRDMIAEDCMVPPSSAFEISISDGQIYANFSKDSIYMKYYAYPKDENGVPEIPDIEYVEKAMEWCIKYEILMNMWINNSVPGIENRWQYAKQQYDFWMSEAKKFLQLSSFAQMVETARRNRRYNKIALFVR